MIVGIISSVIAGIIIATSIYYFSKMRNKHLLRHYYAIKFKHHLKELIKSLSKRHPAIRFSLVRLAVDTAVHLAESNKGEPISLEEYATLLEDSLSEKLKECIFVAKTRPSDWFSRGYIGVRIKDYLDRQIQLKNKMEEKFKIRRYIVLHSEDFYSDPNKDIFINHHKNAKIDIYFCPSEKLSPGFLEGLGDTAFFKDITDRAWIIEGRDFDENTISKYVESRLPLLITVSICDDQTVLNHYYRTLLETIDRAAVKL